MQPIVRVHIRERALSDVRHWIGRENREAQPEIEQLFSRLEADHVAAGRHEGVELVVEIQIHELQLIDRHTLFQLAQIVSDADFRQQLLVMRSESERLQRLAGYFPFHARRHRHADALREKAPRNGHSKHLPVTE